MKVDQKAVIYARFSSELQRDESIDAQIRAITEYADRNNIIVTGQYIDRAKSATNDKRPEFQRMIKDAKSKKFNAVLVHKLDRFARNRQDSIGYKMELKRCGVSVISVTEPLDGSPESIILESVLEAMAEYYSKNLAREVEKGKIENALQAKHVGGQPPLGYDVDRSTMKLVINESEANAVRLIYTMFLDGCGYGEISDELRLRGYKTKRGDDFRKNSLFSILKNPKYTGVYIYNRSASKNIDGKRSGYKDESEFIIVEGAVPAIISKEDFKLVQDKMITRKRKAASNTANEIYILSGKVECGLCGCTYAGNSRHTVWKHRQYVDYRCNKKGGKTKCTNKGIRRETLEAFVLDRLSDFIFDERQIPEIVDNYNKYLLARDGNLIALREQVSERLKELQKNIDSIIDLLVKASSDTLIERLNTLEAEKKETKRKYDELVEKTNTTKIDSKKIKLAFRKARELLKKGELSTTKILVERYVNKIVVYPEDIYVEFNLGLDIDYDGQKEIPQNPTSKSTDSTANLCALTYGENENITNILNATSKTSVLR